MGMVYRTTCRCVASAPQPSPAEYDSAADYERALRHWEKTWDETVREHEGHCPRADAEKGE